MPAAQYIPKNHVDILLSVYNGERFLAEQVNSLLTQTHPNTRILVRDDGSTDNSPHLLKALRLKHPQNITLLPDNHHLGIVASWSRLLETSTAPYAMFCDQDDVWFPKKTARTLAAMRDSEIVFGSDTPLLVHTDLAVVDQEMNLLDPSFHHYQHLDPRRNSLNRLLVQNVITGCTVMINKPLRELAAPLPDDILMHDWWLGLVAAAFGQILFLDEATMHYRQHGINQVGAKRWGLGYIRHMISQDQLSHLPGSLEKTFTQASIFLTTYSEKLSPETRNVVLAYSQLNHVDAVSRTAAVLKHRFFKHGIIRNLGYLLAAVYSSERKA